MFSRRDRNQPAPGRIYHPLPPATSQDPPLSHALLPPERRRFPPPLVPASLLVLVEVVDRTAPRRTAARNACAAAPKVSFLGSTRLTPGAAVLVPSNDLTGVALASDGGSAGEVLEPLWNRWVRPSFHSSMMSHRGKERGQEILLRQSRARLASAALLASIYMVVSTSGCPP